MIELYYISLILFAAYILANIVMNGIPKSISDTFYSLNNAYWGLGYVFFVWCGFLVISFAALMFEHSDGQWFQFLGLFAAGGLLLVGAAPHFKTHEHTIHFAAAAVCAVAAVVWMVLMGYWFVPVSALAVAFCLPKKENIIFYGECALFVSMYVVLFLIN